MGASDTSIFTIRLNFLLLIAFTCSNATSIVGTWHINNKGYPMQTGTTLSRSMLIIKQSSKSQNICDGLDALFLSIKGIESVANITQCSITQSFYINNTILFNFCTNIDSKTNCFEAKILEGIMTGHTCTKSINEQNCSDNNLNSLLPFSGWNQLYFDTTFALQSKYNASRDFLLTIYPLNEFINNNLTSYCHIRIDYNQTNQQYIGRYKIFQQIHGNKHDEQLEYDLRIIQWDGKFLQFILYPVPNNQSIYQTFSANIQFITLSDGTTVISRGINGTYTDSRYTQLANFTGIRWNILSPGLMYHTTSTDFILWQNRSRQLLKFLMMFGNPPPLSIKHNITKTNVSHSCLGIHRDDNCNEYTQDYEIYNVTLYFTIPNWYDNDSNKAYVRKVHGFMSFPFDKNVTKFVLSVNGHTGSSYQMMFTPNNTHDWYGDAFARRNYIELSIDISHRNTTPMYHDSYNNGDDPQHDNGPHPAIRYFGDNEMVFSDFEEDGERVYDAVHATKWFFSAMNPYNDRLINIDDKQRYVTGHSMGGEITTFIGALFSDELFAGGVIPGGFSPDLDVMYFHGNHPCWRWMNSNVREHIDTAVLHGLILPRLLIVLTGQQDTTYSNHNPPYSADKQVLRRSRQYGGYFNEGIDGAFGLNIFHYLHYDAHHYHVGDIDDNDPNLTHLYVQVSSDIKPNYFDDVEWEMTANTSSVRCPKNESIFFNLFDLLNYYQLNQTVCRL